jgi:ribosome-associated protein
MSQEAPISKTRRKREMLALQELGVELAGLGDEQLAALDLPDVLRDAVVQARRITRFEARRRHFQYIGKLMRNVDPEPIRAMLDERRARAHGQDAALRRVEAWRERLLTDRDGLAKLLAEHPDADASRLRALIDSARRERAEAQPPHSSRELFRALRSLLE